MTNKQIEQMEEAFRAHGYAVMSEAISGMEEEFLFSLKKGFVKVENVLAHNSKVYGFKGLSKRALSALHQDLPNPAFGIEAVK